MARFAIGLSLSAYGPLRNNNYQWQRANARRVFQLQPISCLKYEMDYVRRVRSRRHISDPDLLYATSVTFVSLRAVIWSRSKDFRSQRREKARPRQARPAQGHAGSAGGHCPLRGWQYGAPSGLARPDSRARWSQSGLPVRRGFIGIPLSETGQAGTCGAKRWSNYLRGKMDWLLSFTDAPRNCALSGPQIGSWG